MIPNDAYGLALYALDKTYSPKPKTGLTGTHAFNLNVSPFSSSKSKHAAICSAVGGQRKQASPTSPHGPALSLSNMQTWETLQSCTPLPVPDVPYILYHVFCACFTAGPSHHEDTGCVCA
jgi:hypothetical protein